MRIKTFESATKTTEYSTKHSEVKTCLFMQLNTKNVRDLQAFDKSYSTNTKARGFQRLPPLTPCIDDESDWDSDFRDRGKNES
jgi:hypothetical protein